MATTPVARALAQTSKDMQVEKMQAAQADEERATEFLQEQAAVLAQEAIEKAETARVAAMTTGEKAVELAQDYIGTPYVYGGSTPQTGFDCSGFTRYVYKKLGVKLAHIAQEQYDASDSVDLDSMEPGDLVFFGSDTASIYHVGMYVGDGKYIHSPQTGESVKIADLAERTNLIAAARPY